MTINMTKIKTLGREAIDSMGNISKNIEKAIENNDLECAHFDIENDIQAAIGRLQAIKKEIKRK